MIKSSSLSVDHTSTRKSAVSSHLPAPVLSKGKSRDGKRVDDSSKQKYRGNKPRKGSKSLSSDGMNSIPEDKTVRNKQATSNRKVIPERKDRTYATMEQSASYSPTVGRRRVDNPGNIVSNGSLSSSRGGETQLKHLPSIATNYSVNSDHPRLSRQSTKSPNDSETYNGNRSGFFSKLIESWFGSSEYIVLKNPYARDIADQYDLQQWHLRKLKRRFQEIDVDKSGSVSSEEFLEATTMSRSPFTDKLFALIDLDGSGTIEFDEFVAVLAVYCTMSKNDILKFCFECFDVDRSGAIDEREFVQLCKSVHGYGGATFPSNFTRALEDFDVNEDGFIDYNEFVMIERRYPMILFPAFKLQDAMQKFSLGEKTWLKILEAAHAKKKIEEYKKLYGKPPPDKWYIRIFKAIFTSGNTPTVKTVELNDEIKTKPSTRR